MTLKPPPLLLGLTFTVWGLYLGMGPLGLIMGALVELSRLPNLSLEVNLKEVRRIIILCVIVSSIIGLYAIRNNNMDTAAFLLVKWLPMVWYLPLLIEYYGSESSRPYKAMIPKIYDGVIQPFHLGYPFFSLLLISTGSNIYQGQVFYPVICALIAYAMWPVRSKRYPVKVWAGAFIVLVGLGHMGHTNLRRVQQEWSEDFVRKFKASIVSGVTDPYRNNTSMGHIGSLKMSERILMRVSPNNLESVPSLLRAATYNRLNGETWLASRDDFISLNNLSFETWEIQPEGQPGRGLRVVQDMPRGKGMLPLPLGAYKVDRLAIPDLTRHPMGAVRVEEGPELLNYDVFFDPANEVHDPPRDSDLTVPRELIPALEQALLELGASNDPEQMLRATKAYFLNNFTYTLDLTKTDDSLPPVSDFLLNGRRGHCEYFATATTLLLRQVGVPARYAVGFSVQEYSPLEGAFLIRRRHSHAWTLAYINGAWINVDTTPPDWNSYEEENSASLLGIYDFFSMLWTRFTLWRMKDRDDTQYRYLILLVIPPALYFVWKRTRRSDGKPKKKGEAIIWPGDDSECFKIIEALLTQAMPRLPGETLAQWFARIKPEGYEEGGGLLGQILTLHYRYRFDPLGLNNDERTHLRGLVEQWMNR